MNSRLVAVLLPTLTSALIFGCGGSNAATTGKSFGVLLKATSDDGEPLEGVKFTTGTTPIGISNSQGVLSVNIRGDDGQMLPVRASCPDEYVSPEHPSKLKLTEVRRINQAESASLQLEVVCTRKLREVVIVVRTNHAPSLPVDAAGRNVGTTDYEGNAHVRLQLDRDVRSLSVSLATNDAPTLRPQNPSRVYELSGQDTLLIFDQSFTAERRSFGRRTVATTASPVKHVPYRIDSGKYHGR